MGITKTCRLVPIVCSNCKVPYFTRKCKPCVSKYNFWYNRQNVVRRAWKDMKRRCYDTNYHSFHRYGGRGIKVADIWMNNFDLFYQTVGDKPSLKHSLDRINNNLDYQPGNVRWATPLEQVLNRECVKVATSD
jgi:hypothetical protein